MKRLLLVAVLAFGSTLTGAYAKSDVIELGQRLKHADKEERRLAAYELQQLGADAAPVVRQLTKALGDDDDQVWFRATMALANIGPKAGYAIPRLIEEMGGKDTRYAEQRSHRSAYALSEIGEAAIPALVKALQDENEHRRWGALHAFGLMGHRPQALTEAIVARLADEDESVRREAIETSVAYGSVVVEEVVAQLGAENEIARVGAAIVLRRLGSLAASQRDRLRHALIAEDIASVRAALLEACVAQEMDPEFLAPFVTDSLLGEEVEQDAAFQSVLVSAGIAEEMVPKLALLLSDPAEGHRVRAANLLGRLGAVASPAASALVARLQHGSPESSESEHYLDALVLIGPSVLPQILAAVSEAAPESMDESHWAVRALQGLAPVALPELEGHLPTAPPSVACALLRALPKYSRRHRVVEKPVRAWLGSDSESLRAGAVTMLSRLSLPNKVWVAAQTKALKDPSANVRIAAITTLDQVPVSNKERLSRLTDALEDDEPVVRRRAVEALGDMGALSKDALPVLLASVQGPSPTAAYRNTVIQTFGKIGKEAAAAVPYLRSLLHDEMDEATCLQSLGALGAIGSRAKTSIPEVLTLSKSDSSEVRRVALEALSHVSDQAEQKVSVLLAALEDPSAEVRQTVMMGLGRLREEGAAAADRLVDLLDSEEDRKVALEALREIRPNNLELCLRLLKSENAGGRLLACDRLGRMKDPKALPELRKAMRDEHRYVRRRAREAISRIEQATK